MSEDFSVDDDVAVTITRDSAALIISASENVAEVLGWLPEQLIGRPSTELVHPEDQPSAVSAWFEMVQAPGATRTWQGRYRTSAGSWKWIECINVNRLDHPDNPIVFTTMRAATVDQASLAEELRARKQLLSRLSDAMPIGMFQIDRNRVMTFTNDRLHAILGIAASATAQAQFRDVVDQDRQVLAKALADVLANQSVDHVELRFTRAAEQDSPENRVCVLSMRPLTDEAGLVTGAVGCVIDSTERVQLRHQLQLRANTDELASCFNRSAILELLTSSLERKKGRDGVAVVFVDLCRFKQVNDIFGHAGGDRVLELAASRLRAVVREGDFVGRFGGDEFLVVCPGVDSERLVTDIAERIRSALTDRMEVRTGTVELQASIGVSWSVERLDADTLVAQADQAMYQAKRSGSIAIEVFAGSAH